MSDEPLVLGIETSCDETGIGVVRGTTLLADAVASSVEEHARFGGVVPEVASRAHLEAMVPTVHRALSTAGVRLARPFDFEVAGTWILDVQDRTFASGRYLPPPPRAGIAPLG